MLKVNREVLAACAMVASEEPSRYALTGVFVRDMGKGKGAAVGTDGKYLMRVRFNGTPEEGSAIAAGLAGKNGAQSAILSRDAIADTMKRLPKSAKGADSSIGLAIGEAGAHVAGLDGIALPVATVEGSFPNSDDVFPAREEAVCTLDAVRLRDLCDAMLKAHGNPDFLPVDVFPAGKLSALTLVARVPKQEPGARSIGPRGPRPGLEVEALLMPLTV